MRTTSLDDDISVTVDALSPDLAILDCSPGFASLCGSRPIGSGLLSWIATEADVFVKRLHDLVNAVASGRETGERLKFGRLALRLPGRGRLGMRIRGKCLVDIVDHSADISSDDEDEAEEEEEDCERASIQAILRFERVKKGPDVTTSYSDAGSTPMVRVAAA